MVEELDTKSLKCGKRLYHFNLKKTSGGNKYIDIVEIRNQEKGRRKDRIMVFEDHIGEFIKTLEKMASNLAKIK